MTGDEGTVGSTRIGRRELVRRGAALGAALAVANPVVQSIGHVSAFAQTSPPPPSGPIEYPSHFQILFTVGSGGTVYGAKYDEGDGGWGDIGRGSTCWPSDQYQDAGDHASLLTGTVTRTAQGDRGAYRFTPPPSVTIVDARTFDAGSCGPSVEPVDGTFTFAKA